MSRPTTPPAGLASGAHCLPAGAWRTRRRTNPHTSAPPHHTYRHGGISLPHVPPRVSGAVVLQLCNFDSYCRLWGVLKKYEMPGWSCFLILHCVFAALHWWPLIPNTLLQ